MEYATHSIGHAFNPGTVVPLYRAGRTGGVKSPSPIVTGGLECTANRGLTSQRKFLSGTPVEFAKQIKVIPRLPPSSWLAQVQEDQIDGFCGTNVELFESGLVEGCWSGTFNEYGFKEATEFFGSGVVIENEALIFVSPTHTLEALYVLNGHERIIVSNSLAFLLQFSEVDLPMSKSYGRLFATLSQGIHKYKRTICKIGSDKLLRVSYTNLTWHRGALSFSDKSLPPRFKSFEAYRDYLLKALRKTFENGLSDQRMHKWSPITSCSSGYDSPACASLAASLGCKEAVGLKTSDRGTEDSGRGVAKALNIQFHEYARRGRADDPNFSEAEFIATGMGGEDYPFHIIEDRLRHKIFLTGYHGDKVWDLNVLPNASIERGDISGSSMTEWRLRIGFILVPVPFIGVIRHEDIHDISLSDNLKDYRIGGSYDRPVPRKIVEDMGVARKAFGQSKKAVSVRFFNSLEFLSAESIRDFNVFRHSRLNGRTRIIVCVKQFIYSLRSALSFFALRVLHKLKMQRLGKVTERVTIGDREVFAHSSPLRSDLLFLWAITKVKDRYRISEEQ